jgi:hypothetical protein
MAYSRGEEAVMLLMGWCGGAPDCASTRTRVGARRCGSPPFGSSLADARSRPHKHTRPMTPWSEGLKLTVSSMRGGLAKPVRAATCTSLRRGSGYEQAKAKLRCIKSDEVAVAFGPPA